MMWPLVGKHPTMETTEERQHWAARIDLWLHVCLRSSKRFDLCSQLLFKGGIPTSSELEKGG